LNEARAGIVIIYHYKECKIPQIIDQAEFEI